jgi:sulfur relay (sulfurtransferase) DsrC/TusE family protein
MNQIKYGIKVEMEHKPTFNFIKKYVKKHGQMPSDTMMAKKIVQNHLAEDKNYYKKIKKYKL